ncbi:ABC transporter permease [Celeribacter indicus]|uniref:ABC transporter permease n=1 Tax=Celeribacter indicus TaxID=1208324 RepID=UPI0005C34580|nr:SMP-30/gluconolactonase/LRE family protein [Celeribacter indicus]SDX45445.1 monosaccharide ABC transporter membrane protein, CUT2 family [Celeribacter indicus]
MSVNETYLRWRYRYIPDHVLGEVLAKNWIDNAIPVLFLAIAVAVFSILIPGFFTVGSLSTIARVLGEYMFICIGMTLVLKAGGIDLSVGSNFALCNFGALYLVNALGMPLVVVIPAVLLLGGLVGALNGVLIGYMRLRAFLTTLVTLILVRAIVELLSLNYGVEASYPASEVPAWDYLGLATILGLPVSLFVAGIVAIAIHVLMTRMRFGWHLSAVGGSRRSAYNVGLPVKRIVAQTYVMSGVLTAAGALFYASRLGSIGGSVGVGLEIVILTAAVLGGNSLGGGRGSVAKAIIGTVIVVLVTNALVRLGLRTGANDLVLGLILLAAVAIDVKWVKNRLKILNRAYVSPTYFALPPCPETVEGSSSIYEVNDKLAVAEPIGLGELDGPEDIILDEDDNLYCGSRHGDVIRFFAPDYKRHEVYVHIGGHPLGMAFNRDRELVVCVGGMGLYKVTKDRKPVKLSDETNRSLFSIIDDSRMRLADDLDIASDGRIFFSEATIRYEIHDWILDALEARGNGRIICYDPRDGSSRTVLPNLQFPNGITMVGDDQSFLFAETWGCRINRYWYDGPRKGQREVVIPDLPGYPDNINRASDGTFWCAVIGMRSPTFDLAQRMPQFRRRMVYRVAADEWMYPNMNAGCVFKFSLEGEILDVLWDRDGVKHPSITSMREHKGKLYLGGLFNDRIGVYDLPDADPHWTGIGHYWGAKNDE